MDLDPSLLGGLSMAVGGGITAVVQHLVKRRARAAAKRDEVDAATAQVRTAEIADGADERRLLWQEIGSLRQQITQLRAELAGVVEDRHAIRVERDGLRLANEQLVARLREAREDQATAERERDELAARVRGLTDENEQLRRALQ